MKGHNYIMVSIEPKAVKGAHNAECVLAMQRSAIHA
jgi:hypothetical protein